MRPLFLAAARPMNVEWKIRPYFGVFPLVFSALDLGNKLMANYTLKHHALKKIKSEQHPRHSGHTGNKLYCNYLSEPRGGCSDWGVSTRKRVGSLLVCLSTLKSTTAPVPLPCHHCGHLKPQQGRGAPVPEQGLFCSEDLHCRRWILGQISKASRVGDETCTNLKANIASQRIKRLFKS